MADDYLTGAISDEDDKQIIREMKVLLASGDITQEEYAEVAGEVFDGVEVKAQQAEHEPDTVQQAEGQACTDGKVVHSETAASVVAAVAADAVEADVEKQESGGGLDEEALELMQVI